MSAQADPAYIAGRAAIDRVSPLIAFDSNTAIGSNYWNLRNALDIARGDVLIGGTPVSAETHAAVFTADGELQPAMRADIITRTANLNAAFPITATTPVVVIPNNSPPIIAEQGGLLGGLFDGEIFGVPKKFLIIGAAAYFLLKD